MTPKDRKSLLFKKMCIFVLHQNEIDLNSEKPSSRSLGRKSCLKVLFFKKNNKSCLRWAYAKLPNYMNSIYLKKSVTNSRASIRIGRWYSDTRCAKLYYHGSTSFNFLLFILFFKYVHDEQCIVDQLHLFIYYSITFETHFFSVFWLVDIYFEYEVHERRILWKNKTKKSYNELLDITIVAIFIRWT